MVCKKCAKIMLRVAYIYPKDGSVWAVYACSHCDTIREIAIRPAYSFNAEMLLNLISGG